MTHITNRRVIDNHAAMGKSPSAAPDTPFLTLENIFRAGARRAARRREILAAQPGSPPRQCRRYATINDQNA